jgi:hypothetical protein
MASRLAITAATTDAQPLMPQAHGNKAGAHSERRPKPSGNGRPMAKPKGAMTPTATAIFADRGNPMRLPKSSGSTVA